MSQPPEDPLLELAEARRRLARAEAEVQLLRQVLRSIPHGRGDHTDFCRMENEGLPPVDEAHCRCYVAAIRKALGRKVEKSG
ncbi:MAG: hypothetical protein HQL97_09990 [Magnetococcales bacterium]|nr:hypothetical protein [Magnetococcales bacterium]MBF0262149.1 hypothetical protein [Magnetococcales bacterium]